MHVHFEMSGGYGGLFSVEPLEADVESTALDDDERAELEAMARAAIASGADLPDASTMVPDLMTFKLRIVDDEPWEIAMDDRTVPEEMWPLIEYMKAIAVQGRTEGG